MAASPPKFNSLTAHAAQVDNSLIGSIVPLLGTPFDGLKIQIYGDKRTEIVKNHADVIVGDLAYAGNIFGTVTAILNDGETVPANNRIQVTYLTPYMQTPNASSVSNRVVEYNFVDNDESDADGTSKTQNPNAMSGDGVIFIRVVA